MGGRRWWVQFSFPWHSLYLSPLPHGHGAFRGTLPPVFGVCLRTCGCAAGAGAGAGAVGAFVATAGVGAAFSFSLLSFSCCSCCLWRRSALSCSSRRLFRPRAASPRPGTSAGSTRCSTRASPRSRRTRTPSDTTAARTVPRCRPPWWCCPCCPCCPCCEWQWKRVRDRARGATRRGGRRGRR